MLVHIHENMIFAKLEFYNKYNVYGWLMSSYYDDEPPTFLLHLI